MIYKPKKDGENRSKHLKWMKMHKIQLNMSTQEEKVWYNVYIMIHGKFKNCTHSLMGKASERCRFLAE